MDKQSIQHIIDQSEHLASLSNKKKVLKERLDADLTFGYATGIFKIDIELMSHVRFLLENNKDKNTVLLDSNLNPILITDLNKFSDDIQDRYFSSVSKYHAEYQKLENVFKTYALKTGSI